MLFDCIEFIFNYGFCHKQVRGMKVSLLITFSVCLVYETVAQGNIDAIVNDAVQSAFGGGAAPAAPGVAGFGPAGLTGAGPAPAVGQIPASMFFRN